MTRAPRLFAHWVRIRLTPPAPGVQQHGVALLDRIYGLDEQKFPRIQPRPEISVDEVHADRFGFDQHFTPTGEGRGLSTYLKTSGPPVALTSMAGMVTIRTWRLTLCR